MSLPSGYKRLEYIQSTGTQYVNTGVLVSKNLEIKLKFMLTSITNHGIVGYMQSVSSGTNRFAVYQYGGAWYFDFGNDTTGRISGGSFNANTLYDITVGNRYIKNNETESNIISGSVISNLTNSNSISILCETDCGIGKIYSCQIYDNGTLVRDYIPCQTTAGEIGLWDDVNGVFYGNAGTGTFTAGPIIAIAADESEITKLEYIESTGTQHLDSLFKPNNHTRVVIDFQSTFSTANSPKGLLGSRNSSDIGIFAFLYLNRIDPNYNGVGKSVTVDSLQRHVYDFNQNSFSVDGAAVSFDAGVFSPGYNLLLLSVQNYGAIDNRKAEGYLYSCQIYDNDTIIRDYIAAKLSDGTVGLYDKLNGLLYINAGTGTFEAGPSSLNLPVNIGGTWKDANEAFVNIGGTWKTVKAAFVNIDGAWKKLG